MDRIFLESEQKDVIEENVEKKMDSLKSSPRVLAVQEMDSRLKAIAETVRDEDLAPEQREQAANEFNSLSMEYQSLVQEMEEFLQDEKMNAKRKLVETVEALVEEVREVVAQTSKEMDVDLVFEIGGKTSSQVSPIIYLRDRVDLTDAVLAKLKLRMTATEGE